MTTPSGPDNGESSPPGVNLGKTEHADDPTADAPFDPYRFGKPDHPIPAEYAPPGYTGPTVATPPPSPYGSDPASPYPNPYAPPPGPANPFANPPGTPYSGGPPQHPSGQHPGQYPPGQYPQGPYGYGGPPPPPYYGYAPPKNSNGKAIATLVLGILSIVFCVFMFFDGIFVVLAVIFGIIALGETKHGRGSGRGLAVAGLVCATVGAILAVLFTVWFVHIANNCGGISNSNDPGFSQCVRDHV
jgi:hypothetical protein